MQVQSCHLDKIRFFFCFKFWKIPNCIWNHEPKKVSLTVQPVDATEVNPLSTKKNMQQEGRAMTHLMVQTVNENKY